eukprot:3213168-Pleurochrysis_carterae.AAC.1
MSDTGGRLICQEGPISGDNNENIPNFTCAKCNEPRANTNTGGGKRRIVTSTPKNPSHPLQCRAYNVGETDSFVMLIL